MISNELRAIYCVDIFIIILLYVYICHAMQKLCVREMEKYKTREKRKKNK